MPRYRDRSTATFDFGTGPDAQPSPSPARLIPVGNSEVYTGYRRVISDGEQFRRAEDSAWPVADLPEIKGYVELRPEQADEPLLPEDLQEIARRMWEQVKNLSDLQADVLDILTANWLRQASHPNDRAVIDVDDFCRMRGLRAKLAGHGRRGGYTEEQRLTHLRAAQVIPELCTAPGGLTAG